MKWLDIFQNPDGSFSSRRVLGFALMAVGIVGWYLHLSDTVSTLVIGFGAALVGITAFDPHPPA